MENKIKPNKSEEIFLNLAYNKFYDLYEEIMEDTFWNKDSYYRFTKINFIFTVYTELLNYEPLKHAIKYIELKRPPMESNIAKELFKFIRNIMAHFPLFDSWNEVYINKEIINWYKKGMTIDKFLTSYEGKEEVKYRFWNSKKNIMTYLSIKFPTTYTAGENIYLKDILNEKEGVQFASILMKKILDTQVTEISQKDK